MAGAVDLQHVPPRPWYTFGLNFLTHLHVRQCLGGY
jgi:hypothetical protein